MGVWDTLIGLAATALKEHPRKKVLLGLMELRDSMIACQKTFDDYQAVLKEGDYDEVMKKRDNLPRPTERFIVQLYHPREAWRETVVALAETLCDVDEILTIFSPDTSEHVRNFSTVEVDLEGVYVTEGSMEVLKFVDAGIDMKKVSLSSQFRVALRKLDEFIKQNFKVEEVFAAQKDIRAWPYPLRFCGEYWLALD